MSQWGLWVGSLVSREQAVGMSLWATESREQPLVSCLFLFPVNQRLGLKGVLEPYCSSVARQRPRELPGPPPSSSHLAWEGGDRAEGPTSHPTPCAVLFGAIDLRKAHVTSF